MKITTKSLILQQNNKKFKFFQGKQPNVRTHCISKQWLKIIWKTYAWKIEKVWCEKTFVSCYVRHLRLRISCKKGVTHCILWWLFKLLQSKVWILKRVNINSTLWRRNSSKTPRESEQLTVCQNYKNVSFELFEND